MRPLLLSSLFLAVFFACSPAVVFATTSESCSSENSRCDCTQADGTSTSSNDDSISSEDECAASCNTLNATSYALYCDDSLTPAASGNISDYLDRIAAALGVETITKEDPAIPILNVPLPGLDLSNSIQTDANGYITSNMIGLYVNAVFSYAIVLAAILGVLMFSIAGFQYMTAGGDKGAVSKAKARMSNVIFGLIILMATYSIAFMIDPRTTRFNPLVLQNIAAVEYFPPDGEDTDVTPNTSLNGSSTALTGDHLIRGASNLSLDADALVALQEAANDFYESYGEQIYVASAKRDLEKQSTLFYNNCLQTGGSCTVPTCNPASSTIIAKNGSRYSMIGVLAGETNKTTIISQMVANAAYGNCPHTSAVAIDLWCADGGSSYQHDPVCQDQLIKTMIEHGFCRLTSEVWHFELNDKKVSRKNCLTTNNSVTYTAKAGTFSPGANCMRWDFKYHKCIAQR